MLLYKECPECGTGFIKKKNSKRMYCSSKCRCGLGTRNNYTPRTITKFCKVCNKDIGIGKARFCKEHRPCVQKEIKLPTIIKCINSVCINLTDRPKYCSKKCRRVVYRKENPPIKGPAYYKAKKRRRWVEKLGQPISKRFKEEIIYWYENRTSGEQVDHQIPLNHPLVCGLHVPWNFQYLTEEANQLKSNKWELIHISY